MRLMVGRAVGAAAIACMLVSCGDNAKRGEGDDRTAAGEVRGGTISDEMLPLDQLKSQSPPLRVNSGDTGNAEGGELADEGQNPAEDATEPAAAGAEEN